MVWCHICKKIKKGKNWIQGTLYYLHELKEIHEETYMRLLVTGSLGMRNLGQRRLRRPRLYTTQLNNVLQRAGITFVSYKKIIKESPQKGKKNSGEEWPEKGTWFGSWLTGALQGWVSPLGKMGSSHRGRPHFPAKWGWVGCVLPLAAGRESTVLAFTCTITFEMASGKNNWNDPGRGRSCYLRGF